MYRAIVSCAFARVSNLLRHIISILRVLNIGLQGLCAGYLSVSRSIKETDEMIKHSEEFKQEGEGAQAMRGVAEH